MNGNKMNLWKPLCNVMGEDVLYSRHFIRHYWPIESAACLLKGVLPEKFREFAEEETTTLTKEEFRSYQDVVELQKRLLIYFKKNHFKVEGYFDENEKDLCFTPKTILQWTAKYSIPMNEKFYSSLTPSLKQEYIEYHPLFAPLRTKPKTSKAYHRAFYLRNAIELLADLPINYSPKNIYEHPLMKNVLRQIQGMKGRPKERTIRERWIPLLFPKRTKGRPQKIKKTGFSWIK